jgi:hypothetical protein
VAEKGGQYRRGEQVLLTSGTKEEKLSPSIAIVLTPHHIYFSFTPIQGIHPVILLTERGKGYAY